MATEIGKGTKIKLTLETLITVGATIVAVTTMYFTLQADIAQAKELPKQDITKIEYELNKKQVKNGS